MKERLFKFKQFQVSHSRCALPIGVDAVLIGAWSSVSIGRTLDVGCGCGIISLMVAQRGYSEEVIGIDIDPSSVDEAIENFNNSPWKSRLMAIECNVTEASGRLGYFDSIVSNPPFFNSGISPVESARMQARHQGELSPESLVWYSNELLNDNGILSIILPTEMSENVERVAADLNFNLVRRCKVAHHVGSHFKRTMLEFKKKDNCLRQDLCNLKEDRELILYEEDGTPTKDHRDLCRDFYLKF